MEDIMIIRHSLQLLEQLTELEQKIQTIESYLEEKGMEVERDKILLWLIQGQRAKHPLTSLKKN
jgi:hypothetical protein